MRFSARIVGILLSFLMVFFVSKTSFAQSNNLSPNTQTPQYLKSDTNPEVPQNLNTWTQSVMIEIMSSMSCQLAGFDPISPNRRCVGVDTKTGKLGYVENSGGVPAFLVKMITFLYIPPVQTGDYIRYLSSNFGISKPTYAQGAGFDQLKPLLGLWVEFRNISYLLFVIIFIAVGIAVMLRVKIDPRTVMTVQNQIPKMVIGIILVTLSYAIAGLMVDLMWVATYTAASVISKADPYAPNTQQLAGMVQSPTLIFVNDYFRSTKGDGGITSIAGPVAEQLDTTIYDFFATRVPPPTELEKPPPADDPKCLEGVFLLGFICQIPGNIADVVGGAVNFAVTAAGSLFNFLSNMVVGIMSKIVGFLAFLILILAIIYSLFKLWFALIKAYIMILVTVVFAPFWIIAGLLPGASSLGFSGWIRTLAGNLAVFPAVVALFALGRVFVDSFSNSAGTGFIPPLVGNFQGTSIISAIIALGIILGSPEVVSITKKAFKAPEGGFGGGGAMAGAAIGAGAAFVANPLRRAKNAAFGTNERNGQPRFGSAYLGRKFGAVAQVAAGGGIQGRDRWVRVPLPGPVRKATEKVGEAVTRIPGVGAVKKKAGSINASVPQAEEKPLKVEVINQKGPTEDNKQT